MRTSRTTLATISTTFTLTALLASTAAAQMPQTATQETKGAATVTSEKMSGEVVMVEGDTVIVKMSNGDLRTFANVPESRRATIDGKEVGVRDLKPGTKLSATITKTETPITVRTTTVGTGRVAFVSGSTVILTLPNGENKQYKVKPDYKFNINGKPASVYQLRQGMTVSAEKIVEEPKVEIATDTKVVGQAPPAPKPAPTAAAATPAPAPAPAAAPAPVAAAAPAAPAKLPKTASPLPLAGLLGGLFVAISGALRMRRRA